MKKRTIIIAFSLLFIIGIAGTFWGNSIAEAASNVWGTCPRGRVDCPYPGACRLYVDTNGDDICDRSQDKPAATTTTTTIASVPVITSTTSVAVVPVIPSTTTTTTGLAVVDNRESISDVGVTTTESRAAGKLGNSYYFVPILIALAGLYALTWVLSARKIIRNQLHRKIWNVILLISVLVSALLGLFLTLNVDFGTSITLPFNMLFWHVEAGIAMAVVAVFHIWWHWRYFAKIFGMTGRGGEQK